MLDDRDLVAALEQSAWSIFSRFGRGEGASVIDTPTRLVLETPVPQAPYNSVLRFYDEGDRPLEMQVGELLDRFVGREVVMVWLVHPSAPEGLTDSLRAAGLICAEELFGMAVELTAAYTISDPGPDVRISEASPRDPTKWLEIVTERYGVGEQSISFLGDLYTKVAGTTPECGWPRSTGHLRQKSCCTSPTRSRESTASQQPKQGGTVDLRPP